MQRREGAKKPRTGIKNNSHQTFLWVSNDSPTMHPPPRTPGKDKCNELWIVKRLRKYLSCNQPAPFTVTVASCRFFSLASLAVNACQYGFGDERVLSRVGQSSGCRSPIAHTRASY